ncbi:uncharacterized protein EKO05_0000110 [Ascochyta rabiei]|uniref:Uncharacterized protein n=1 Tax=Didymella rabiei TaxID=5454 RepID=A0A163EDS7_DIDRA|nr:uncharacterized protein EKO05_0000110 [Ascochyta rabiei]KZM23650.1 hypothetical protein ST47_g5209 [Ascochyta rabiei]UPX09420.1 hypothetical protein EKO05_0000110 [Ascochyta rabiei]
MPLDDRHASRRPPCLSTTTKSTVCGSPTGAASDPPSFFGHGQARANEDVVRISFTSVKGNLITALGFVHAYVQLHL